METPKVYGLWCGSSWASNSSGDIMHSPYPQVMAALNMSLGWGDDRGKYKVAEIGIDGQPIDLPAVVTPTDGTSLYGIDCRLYEILHYMKYQNSR